MAAIVFDLDGTLIDSAPDLRGAANRMLADEGLGPLDLPTITRFIGNGVPVLVQRIAAHSGLPEDADTHARLLARFTAHYAAAPADLTRIYSGVPQMLADLQAAGHVLGICTNKPEAPARDILHRLDLAAPFAAVVGGDTLAVRKPDPAPLMACLAQLGAARGVMVGDSETDAETAANAGMPFALFSGGYRKTPVTEITHHALFDGFDDLPGLLERLS